MKKKQWYCEVLNFYNEKKNSNVCLGGNLNEQTLPSSDKNDTNVFGYY